jgi:hypothetical protein
MTFSRRGYWRYNRRQQQRTTTKDNNRGPQLQKIREIRQRNISRRGCWRYNRGQQQRTSAAKDTGDTTKDHQQKRILEV